MELLEKRNLLSGNNIVGFDGDTLTFSGPEYDATPTGITCLLAGDWYDVEKTQQNTQDDLMCWAGAASNVLKWTGWGNVSNDELNNPSHDEIFQYYQDHWTDQGGLPKAAWYWWGTGTNMFARHIGWSQVDVDGGMFFPDSDIYSHMDEESYAPNTLTYITERITSGYGTTLQVYGPGAHAITCWGFNYEPDGQLPLGVWVTDSDDGKHELDNQDWLRYYEVEYHDDHWYLQDFYNSNSWYIGSVNALDRNEKLADEVTSSVAGNIKDFDSDLLNSTSYTVFCDSNNNGILDDVTYDTAKFEKHIYVADNSTVTSTLTIDETIGNITDVNLTLTLWHNNVSDLTVSLINPHGLEVELVNCVGGSSNHFNTTVFDDNAATSIDDGYGPFTGTFKPLEPLSIFNGFEANGEWTLKVSDNVDLNPGALSSWSIDVTAQESFCKTDDVGNFILENVNGDTRLKILDESAIKIMGKSHNNLCVPYANKLILENYYVDRAMLEGDINLDGIVDDLDASILAYYWQSNDNHRSHGDLNGDGKINDIDASILASNWMATNK